MHVYVQIDEYLNEAYSVTKAFLVNNNVSNGLSKKCIYVFK